MNRQEFKLNKAPESASAFAETIESPMHLLQQPQAASPPKAPQVRKQIALIEGSAPQLSHETLDLLRDRLRIVSLLLAGGFAVFLLRGMWSYQEYIASRNLPLFIGHATVTLLLAVLAWRLCVRCPWVLSHLRLAEFLVFGTPAVFFAFLTYRKLAFCANLADGHAHIPNVTGGWGLLIIAYAMFIPNHWRRAAFVLVQFGLAPLLMFGLASLHCGAFRELLASESFFGMFTEHFLVLALMVVMGTVGVHTIGTLRQEAFTARQLGQYRLRQMLGSGGMGEVYLAEHQMMKRPCAIKVIRPEKAGDPHVLARFEREVQATAKLSHWNSIDIYDYGRTEDGTFYYVMEFLPGHNIGELVELYGPLPANRVVHLMTQVCEALAEAHAYDLVHRDIKPANIYCACRGGLHDVAKILDFGLAKPLDEGQDSGLTQEGAITGSPLYMSPEQATGSNEVDARSDIYSLGAVMYLMATGRPPFDYPQPIKVLVAHASESPQPPRELNADVSVELEEIILRCLEKRPEDRFQTVDDLREQLLRVPVETPWTSRVAAEWWNCHGCPERKKLAAEALELAAG
jgi:serine/threonine-protein kinase